MSVGIVGGYNIYIYIYTYNTYIYIRGYSWVLMWMTLEVVGIGVGECCRWMSLDIVCGYWRVLLVGVVRE